MTLEIPMIDLGEYFSTTGSKEESVQRFRSGASKTGFVLIRPIDFQQCHIDALFDCAKALKDLSLDEKLSLYDPAVHGERGYLKCGQEKHLRGESADLKEALSFGRSGFGYPDNIWPDIKGFKGAVTMAYEWFDHVRDLTCMLIADSLGVQPAYFSNMTALGDSIMRIIHYMPADDSTSMRSAPHTDSNLFTLLYGADAPGLQVQSGDAWYDVQAPPGCFVLNVGEMLERITNGVYPSTWHRVIVPDDESRRRSRFVFPFFVHPRKDVPLDVLANCVSADNPQQWPSGTPAGAFLSAYLATTHMLGDDPKSKFLEMYDGKFAFELDALNRKLRA